MNTRTLILGGLAICGLAACGGANAAAPTTTEAPTTTVERTTTTTEVAVPRLERIAKTCSEAVVKGVNIEASADGRSLTVDTHGEEDRYATGNDPAMAACVLVASDAPESVVQRISHTRALDGVQDGEWNGYVAVWSYHPDSGLFLLIEEGS